MNLGTRAGGPLRLRARAVAAAVPTRFSGRVHSVFRHVCNLELSGGEIVPLIASGRVMPPGAIRVAGSDRMDFVRHVAPGEEAGCRAGSIHIGANLTVGLHGARSWNPPLPQFSWAAAGSGGEPAWQVAAQWVQRLAGHEASGLLRQRLAQALDALSWGDGASAAGAVGALVGRGPGLTPSGDDAIVGLLAALWFLAAGDNRWCQPRDALGRTVCRQAARTTAISRSYLSHAAQGRFGSQLIALGRALGAGHPERARRSAALAGSVGGHSGGDAVLGLLAGLAAAHPEPRRLRIRLIDSLAGVPA